MFLKPWVIICLLKTVVSADEWAMPAHAPTLCMLLVHTYLMGRVGRGCPSTVKAPPYMPHAPPYMPPCQFMLLLCTHALAWAIENSAT